MKKYKETYIIGIDHGYGNMKTANCCFQTGVTVYEKEPIFKDNLLVWNKKYYLIGAEHKEFSADKMLDEDYYVLTLAAIARELNIAKIYSADVLIAAGLPLTWVSEQREEFKRYLLKNETVDFNFKGKDYHIRIVGADVYPQGFAAIVNHLSDFSGVNMLCDIGNGTMNIMFVNDKKPNPHRCFTEKFGTHQCMLHIRENLMRIHHSEPPEEMITRVLRFGAADIDGDYLKTITNILMLVAKYHESNCEDKTILANINKSIDASVELRSKKALIEGFVAQMTVKTDVEKDWKDFVKKQKEQDLEAIIKDEKLKHDEAQKFIENSFRDGGIKTTGTDLDKILPPISRFSGGSNRALKKQTVIDKLKDFFEKYFGLV